jgi:hypothetical protein
MSTLNNIAENVKISLANFPETFVNVLNDMVEVTATSNEMMVGPILVAICGMIGSNGSIDWSEQQTGKRTEPFVIFHMTCTDSGSRKSSAYKLIGMTIRYHIQMTVFRNSNCFNSRKLVKEVSGQDV